MSTTDTLQTRSFEIRSTDKEKREITGIGVPYETEVVLWDIYREKFARGSVDAEGAILRYGHREPIGAITNTRDTEEGFEITAKISDTNRGREVWQLIKDNVLTKMSIGFEPVEKKVTEDDDGTTHITWTKVRAREFSVVEFPQYPTAKITNHRSKPDMDTETTPNIEAINDRFDTLERSLAVLKDRSEPKPEPVMYRSFGEYVAAYKKGDEKAKTFQREAYKSGDHGATLPTWLGVLEKRMAAKQPVKNMFRTIALPSTGMTMEYAVKKTDSTIQVAQQTAEGANLVVGRPATWEIKAAPVQTFGGVTDEITRQAIERTTAPSVLDEIFTDQAFEYAKAVEAAVTAEFKGNLETAEANPVTTIGALTDLTADNLLEVLLALSDEYEDTPYLMDGIAVSPTVFEALLKMPYEDRALKLMGAPDKHLGTLSLLQPGKADIGNIFHVQRVKALTGEHFAAYSQEATTTAEDPGAPLRLEDDNIENLTRRFGVYGYAAIYSSRPDLVKAVKIGG